MWLNKSRYGSRAILSSGFGKGVEDDGGGGEDVDRGISSMVESSAPSDSEGSK